MARTTDARIEKAQEVIRQQENLLKQLRQKQKSQERKARDHRLYKRAGLLESLLPETIALTDEQFEKFLKRCVVNSHCKRALEVIASDGETETPPTPNQKASAENMAKDGAIQGNAARQAS